MLNHSVQQVGLNVSVKLPPRTSFLIRLQKCDHELITNLKLSNSGDVQSLNENGSEKN